MNSSGGIDQQRIARALATLRQKVERVLKSAPDLMEIGGLDQLPPERARLVEDSLFSIFIYGEYYVEKVMEKQSEPIVSAENKGNFDYYKKEYKDTIKKIRGGLIDVSSMPDRADIERFVVEEISPSILTIDADIDLHMNEYEEYVLDDCFHKYLRENQIKKFDKLSGLKASLWKVTEVAYHHYVDLKFEGHEQKLREDYREPTKKLDQGGNLVDTTQEYEKKWIGNLEPALSECRKIMEAEYFKPDEWKANKEDLSPFIVTENMQKIPQPIQKRVYEIYYSYVFGNPMAAIALSRCLLESALLHRRPLLKKRLDKPIEFFDKSGDPKRIGELADIAGEAFPELKDSMETVIQYGNHVMHPFRRIPYNKIHAKQSFEAINEIISTLYSY